MANQELLDQCLKPNGLENEPESLLFQVSIGKSAKLSRRRWREPGAADMPERPLKQGKLPAHYQLIYFGRKASRIYSGTTVPLKPLNESPGHADSRPWGVRSLQTMQFWPAPH
jgi:hypothetical protein